MKIYFCLLFVAFINIDAARVSKPDKAVGAQALQAPNGRPQYINQFSQSLKFLSSFFRILQKELISTIDNFNPSRPPPVFTMLLQNPRLIPMALRQLKEPIAEMIVIMDKIEGLMAAPDANNQLANSQELQKLLTQLHRRLQTMFGALMPNSALSSRMPTPTDIPALVESLSTFVAQFASTFAAFSQSVRDISDESVHQNRSKLTDTVDQLCARLKKLPNRLDLVTALTGRQTLDLGSLITDAVNLVSGLLNVVTGLLGNVLGGLTGIVTTSSSLMLDEPTTAIESKLVVPLTTTTVNGVQVSTVGLVVKDKLNVLNVMTGDYVAARHASVEITSLRSLQSMMSAVVLNMKSRRSQFWRIIRCELDLLECSLFIEDDIPQVETCLQTFSNCTAAAF